MKPYRKPPPPTSATSAAPAQPTANTPAPPRTTSTGPLGHHLRSFLQYIRVECGLAKNTLTAYQRDLHCFEDFLQAAGKTGLQGLTHEDISAYAGYLAENGLQPSSRARMLIAVRMFFRFAVAERVLPADPCAIVDQPKLWKHLPNDLSPVEVTRLLEAEDGRTPLSVRNRAILETFYATGARVSEVCGLQMRHTDLASRTVRVMGKGRKERMIPLGNAAVDALAAYLNGVRPLCNKKDSAYVFLSKNGEPLDRHMVFRIVQAAANKAGITKNVHPHLLRHSFATHMLEGGANLRIVQELLGHADLATTEIYTHVKQNRLQSIYTDLFPRA